MEHPTKYDFQAKFQLKSADKQYGMLLHQKFIAGTTHFNLARFREEIMDIIGRYQRISLLIETENEAELDKIPEPEGPTFKNPLNPHRYQIDRKYQAIRLELEATFRRVFHEALQTLPREIVEQSLTTMYFDRTMIPQNLHGIADHREKMILAAYQFLTDAPLKWILCPYIEIDQIAPFEPGHPLHDQSWESHYVQDLIAKDKRELRARVPRQYAGPDAMATHAILKRTPTLSPILEEEYLRRYLEMICGREATFTPNRDALGTRATFLVFFDPVDLVAYTDTSFLRKVPSETRKRLVPIIALQSHSKRAFFFVLEDGTVCEFKGFTPRDISHRHLHMHSQDPTGVLTSGHALAEILGSEILGELGPNVQYREMHGGFIATGEAVSYGQLARFMPASRNRRFTPWVRFDHHLPFIREWAEWEGKDVNDFLDDAAENLGRQVGTLHRADYYMLGFRDGELISFAHPGNVEIHGNLIDLESAESLEELIALCTDCGVPNFSREKAAGTDLLRLIVGLQHTMGKDQGIYFKLIQSPPLAERFVHRFATKYGETLQDGSGRDYFMELMRCLRQRTG